MKFYPGKGASQFLVTNLYDTIQRNTAEMIASAGVYISDLNCEWPAVTVPRDLLGAFEDGFFVFRDDVRAWLDAEIPAGAYRFIQDVAAIGFADPDDAMAFRMKWV